MSSAPPGPTPFVIISAPRSGSTMLSSMLASRPDFVVCGELLNNVWIDEGGSLSLSGSLDPEGRYNDDQHLHQLRRENPIRFLNEVHGMAVARGAAAFGFKLLYAHGYSRPKVVEYLASVPNLRVLHITRLDPLARLVSLRRAMHTGLWVEQRAVAQTDVALEQTLHLEPESCAADFEEQHQLGEHYRNALEGGRTLELTYESLEADPEAVGNSVQRFLGFEPQPLTTHTHKQARRAPRESVDNWDELATHFASTRWRHLFQDAPGSSASN